MSFLFDEKSRKAMKWIWGAFAILIIISMIVLYTPGLLPTGADRHAPVSQAIQSALLS